MPIIYYLIFSHLISLLVSAKLDYKFLAPDRKLVCITYRFLIDYFFQGVFDDLSQSIDTNVSTWQHLSYLAERLQSS